MQTTQDDGAGLRILYLSENFGDWMAPNYFAFQRAVLEQMPGSIAYGPGILYNNNDVAEIVAEVFPDEGPDAVVCQVHGKQLLGMHLEDGVIAGCGIPRDLTVFPVGLERIKAPKILLIGDFWQCKREEWERAILDNGFDYVFMMCCPPFNARHTFDRFFSDRVQEAVRFVPWPHSVTPDVFRDYGLPRAYDVTILGSMYDLLYPLRIMMRRSFSREKGIDFLTRDHPGYKFVSAEGNLVGESYARVLNQTRIFASCTSIYGIPFQKLYEVAACRSVMMCDRPYGAELLGFVDRETYLSITEDNYVETARHYLAYPEELERIATNAMNVVSFRHTSAVRASEFRETIASLLQGKEPDGWAAMFSEVRRKDRTWSDPREAITKGWRAFGSVRRARARRRMAACVAPFRTVAGKAKRRLFGRRLT